MCGLPTGLLPDAVDKYRLKSNSELEVEIIADLCNVYLPSSTLHYEKTVSGKISITKLEDVKGIRLLQMYGWAPDISVTGIHRVEMMIQIQIDASQSRLLLPQDEFREIIPCSKPKPALKDCRFSGEEYKSGVAVA